jgi:hypothetical protein
VGRGHQVEEPIEPGVIKFHVSELARLGASRDSLILGLSWAKLASTLVGCIGEGPAKRIEVGAAPLFEDRYA